MKIVTLMLFVITALTMATGCKKSDEERVKTAVMQYLKKTMKHPDSVKITSMEIRKDTIPAYLTSDVLDIAKATKEKYNEANYYAEMDHYLFREEILKSIETAMASSEQLKAAYETAVKNDTIDVEYLAYCKASATNSFGETVSEAAIAVVDKNNPDKVIGWFDIDKDFIDAFIQIWAECKEEVKRNKFGKVDASGMCHFEQFVFNETPEGQSL